MEKIMQFNQVEEKILTIRNQNVILDSDVAILYGVETKEINQAVKNNPAKFPRGYIIPLNKEEWSNLKSKFLTSNRGGKKKLPKCIYQNSGIITYYCRIIASFGRAQTKISDAKEWRNYHWYS
ncbi:MAG: ORF6N domain-containing protein [Dysgonamonadaceae bacterium]|jgi:hypothetical protein|nr:ORF6N domain-containing protein [Dysgonamonadaceae bacterium]